MPHRPMQKFAWIVAFLTVVGLVQPATAQMMPEMHLYVVSFECGFQVSPSGTAGYEPMVKVANYATKVDLFNYGMADAGVVAEVYSTGNNRWASSIAGQPLPGNNLLAHNATVIDCVNIAQAINGGGAIPPGKPFYSGMLRIMSPEPLFVWATKTTQVCAGTARLHTGETITPQIVFDIMSGTFINAVTSSLETVDLSLFGCPVNPLSGGFPGPAGEVPPNSRTPHDGLIVGPIKALPSPWAPQGGFTFSTPSVSHSLDFERVEGVVVVD